MSLRDHLQAIYDEHGKLTPQLVMETARPEDHPLHSRVYDRPPEDAAEAWYLHRAHRLIRLAKVAYRRDGSEYDGSIRAFVAVRTGDAENGGYAYEPAEQVAIDPLLRAMALRDMEREWKALFRRYSEFQEFAEIVRRDVDGAAA